MKSAEIKDISIKDLQERIETEKAQLAKMKRALSLIESTDLETTNALMKMKDYVDLLIPRGGRGLIQSVVNNATIPVIETGTRCV